MATAALSNYGFVADPGSLRHSTGRVVDWATVATSRQDADTGKKVIPAGTVLALQSDGGITPRADVVTLTTVIDDGANEVTVTKVAHGFTDGDTLVIAGSTDTQVNGTFVVTVVDADTFTYALTTGSTAETAAGTITASYQAWGLLIGEAREDAPEHALSGYGVLIGGHFFENILPDATGTPKVLPAAYKTELAATAGVFTFEQYSDSRLS